MGCTHAHTYAHTRHIHTHTRAMHHYILYIHILHTVYHRMLCPYYMGDAFCRCMYISMFMNFHSCFQIHEHPPFTNFHNRPQIHKRRPFINCRTYSQIHERLPKLMSSIVNCMESKRIVFSLHM